MNNVIKKSVALMSVFYFVASGIPLVAYAAAPVILSSPPPQAGNIMSTSVNITWVTDIPADSSVMYGPNNTPTSFPYSSSVRCDGGGEVTSHCVSLSSLPPLMTYYFKVISCASGQGCTEGSGYQFTTAAASGGNGACLLRNGSTNLPSYSAIDISTGYAKVSRPGVTDITALRSACTTADYDTLLQQYCSQYGNSSVSTSNSFQQQVALYDSNGNNTSSGCGPDGANCVSRISCPGGGGDTQVPSVPPGLTATPDSVSSTMVAWNASTDNVGVTGYKIYRNGSFVITTPSTSYLDTGLSAGTTYSYTVSAYDAAGNVSSQSGSVSVTTGSASNMPSAPSNLQASFTGGNGVSTNFTWSDNSTNETGFTLYMRPTGGSWRRVTQSDFSANSTQMGITDYNVIAGTYEYKINAVNSYGMSADSNIASITYSASTFAATPSNVIVTASGSNVNVVWTDNANNETEYRVYQLASDGSVLAQVGFGLAANTASWVHNNVANGTYKYRVNACTATGCSLSSNQPTVTVPGSGGGDTQPPTAPALSGSATAPTSVSLSWTASTDNVGVTEYKVHRNGSYLAGGITGLSYTDNSATANTSYTYYVQVYDAAGYYAYSNSISVSTPASGGGSGLLGYWRFDGNGNNDVSGGPAAVTVGSPTFYGSGGKLGGYGYVPGSGSYFKVPYNSMFDLPTSFTVELWFRQRADRSSAQDLVYKGSGTNNYNFRIFRQLWNQYNFGPIITGFTAQSTGYWTQTSNPNQLSHNAWHHVVYTKDASGAAYYLDGTLTHSLSYSGSAVTPATDIFIGSSAVDTDIDELKIYNRALSASEVWQAGGSADTQGPTAPTVSVSAAAASASLSWSGATDNVSVTGYKIYRNGAHLASTASLSYVDTAVAPGTTYTYYVQAYDAAGNYSVASNSVSANIPASGGSTIGDTQTPTTPTGFMVSALAPNYVSLSWNAASDNVGVTTYKIFKNSSFLANVFPPSLTFTDTVVAPSTAYTYAVTALDAANNQSPQTLPLYVTTPAAGSVVAPAAPSLLASTVSGSNVLLTWRDNSSNESGFKLYRGPIWTDIGNVGQNVTSFTVYNLAAGSYDFKVQAFLNTTSSPVYSTPSNIITALIGGTAPPASSTPPVLTTAANTSSSVSLSWTGGNTGYGASIGYKIFRNNVLIATTGWMSYQDTAVAPGANYTYYVSAYDASNNYSPTSNQVGVTIPVSGGAGGGTTGVCMVRNYYTSAPGYYSPDSSTGYAKMVKPGVNDIPGLQSSCSASDYSNLLQIYCASNYSPVQQQVATYNSAGSLISLSCGQYGCNDIVCPSTSASGDTQPPMSPMLGASATASSVALSWSGSTDNVGVTGYRIYRNGAYLTGGITTLAYTDIAVQSGNTYSYFVTAYDAAGNYSANSNQITVTPSNTASTNVPPLLSNARPENIFGSGAQIKWSTDKSSDSRVVWGTSPGNYPQSSNWRCDAGLSVTEHCVNLTGLTPNTIYYYRAISTIAGGYEGYSPEYTFISGAGTVTTPTAFMTDTAPPSVVAFAANPVNGGAQVMFTVKFSEPVRPENLTQQNIFLFPVDYPSYRVTGTLSLRSDGFDFTTSNLPNVDHTFVVSQAVSDLSGNKMVADYISNNVRKFTQSFPTYPYPPIISQTPLYVTGWGLSVDAGGKSMVGALFNVGVDPTTISDVNIFVQKASEPLGSAARITGTYSKNAQSFTLALGSALTVGTEYASVITAKVKSASGVYMNADFVCKFTALASGYYTSCPQGPSTDPVPLQQTETLSAMLVGTVRDALGKAVSGASIHVFGNGSNFGTLAGSDGTFTISLPPGNYYVEGYPPYGRTDLVRPDPVPVSLLQGAKKSVALVFGGVSTLAKTIKGTVLFGNGLPIPDAQVGAYYKASGQWVSTKTDAQGSYVLKVEAGDFAVGVMPSDPSASWRSPGSQAVSFKDNGLSETATVNFRVSVSDAKVSVMVTDEAGLPLQAGVILDSGSAGGVSSISGVPEGAKQCADGVGLCVGSVRVEANSLFQSGSGASNVSRFGYTDANGKLSLTVPRGSYYLRASLPPEKGFMNPAEQQVNAVSEGVANATFTFKKPSTETAATLVGIAKLEDGTLAENALIWGWSEKGGSASARTNEHGEFSVKASLGSRWHLGAGLEMGGFGFKSSESVVDVSQQSNFVSLTLAKIAVAPLPPPVVVNQAATVSIAEQAKDGAKVVIPPVASSGTSTVSASVVPTVEVLSQGAARVVGSAYDISLKDQSGKAITQFNEDVEISLPYSDLDIAKQGVSLEKLAPSYFDEQSGIWVKVDSYTVDTARHLIVMRVKHLTRFALVAPADITPPPSPAALSVKLSGEREVTITWANPAIDFHHVKVYRSEQKADLGLLLDDLVTSGKYIDRGVVLGRTYFYALKSIDAAGNESVPLAAPGKQVNGTIEAAQGQFDRFLGRGSVGAQIKALQDLLRTLGFFPKDIASVESFGALTESAVKAFQAAKGLEQTGGLGPMTRAALNAAGSSGPSPASSPVAQFAVFLARGRTGLQVQSLQELLIKLGFLPKDTVPTGFFGALTEQAVKDFQKSKGLEQTGGLGPMTRSEFNKLLP